MKLFSETFLFCIFIVLSLDILDGNDLQDSVILDGNIHDQVGGLLSSDGSVQATQKDKDVRLSGNGRINLTLDYGELIFEVCPNWDCAEKSKVCCKTTENRIQREQNSAEASSFSDWGYIILAIAAFIVIGVVIGCIAFYFYKKRQSSKRASQKPDETKPKATVFKADVATDVKTPTKKNDDLEAAKVEPTQIPKKNQKKTKTIEPATTEDVPAPKKEKKSKTQEPTTETPTMKSITDEVTANYPDIQHEVLASEIKLLCLPVSQMYAEMNIMAHKAEQKLASVGCKFDQHSRIISVSKGARRFLKSVTTDTTTVYFAFGAEYHKRITDNLEYINKISIPLLYVIALQPRFSEASRRKACAILRRKLVKVLGYFTAAERAELPFPVNIVEHAYCRNPKYFIDPSGIKTDSESDQKMKQTRYGKRKMKLLKKQK